MAFDATDLEIARREHNYELGGESNADRRWSWFYNTATAAIIARGWDEKFTGGQKVGQSRGLDGADDETGYSIDGAYDAFEKGWTVDRYIRQVMAARAELGL